MSYPDIDLLIELADVFGVTVDSLLRGTVLSETENVQIDFGAELPDDGKLRVVQFAGQKMLSVDELDTENVISLHIDNEMLCDAALNVEIWGSAHIDGAIGGNINVNAPNSAGNNIAVKYGRIDVYCGDVGGSIHTGAGNINCGAVGGNIHSGAGNIKCGDVGRDASSGAGNITCGDIRGNARTGIGNIRCTSRGN